MTLAELRDLITRRITDDPRSADCTALFREIGYEPVQEPTTTMRREDDNGTEDPAGEFVVIDTREP